jgi:hypothetical protein
MAIKYIEQVTFSSSIQKSIPARGTDTEAAQLERLQYLRDETNKIYADKYINVGVLALLVL